MIFAAGFGTRLKPITDSIPKALVRFNNKTLLEYTILKLKHYGVSDIIINVHHFSEQIIKFVAQNNFGINIQISDETEKLLNTGGGLYKAKEFLSQSDEAFFVYNVDIISTVNLKELYKYHTANNALATLAVSDRKTSRYLLFDKKNQLSAWENRSTGELKIIHKHDSYIPFAFSGIQMLSPKVFDLIEETGAFSITDMYLRLSKNQKILAFNHTGDFWLDVGKFDQLKDVEAQLSKQTLEFI